MRALERLQQWRLCPEERLAEQWHAVRRGARDHVEQLGIDDLEGQAYLEPHPKERMLSNRV